MSLKQKGCQKGPNEVGRRSSYRTRGGEYVVCSACVSEGMDDDRGARKSFCYYAGQNPIIIIFSYVRGTAKRSNSALELWTWERNNVIYHKGGDSDATHIPCFIAVSQHKTPGKFRDCEERGRGASVLASRSHLGPLTCVHCQRRTALPRRLQQKRPWMLPYKQFNLGTL